MRHFRHCATFFEFYPKGPPSIFRSFATEYKLKSPKGPSHVFSALLDFFFEKNFDQRFPLQVFEILKQNGCQTIAKGQPFSFFGTMRLFKMDEIFQRVPLGHQFVPAFGFFRYCRREYFETLKSFCDF